MSSEARKGAARSGVRRLARVLVFAFSLALFASGPAWAQKKTGGAEGSPAAGKSQAPAVKVERGKGGRKVFRITTGFVIEGRIQKPNAFYVLQRSQINYDWAKLKKDFLPRILEAVKRSPF